MQVKSEVVFRSLENINRMGYKDDKTFALLDNPVCLESFLGRSDI